jgi:hypothetical protein
MTGRSIVAVYALDTLTSRFGIVQGQLGTNWAWLGLDDNTYMTAGNLYGCYLPSLSYDGQIVTTSAARVRSFIVDALTFGQAASQGFRCRLDGADMTLTITVSERPPIGDFSHANTTRVGWGHDNNDDARVAEVLIYDHALGGDELHQVEVALAARYAVTLP